MTAADWPAISDPRDTRYAVQRLRELLAAARNARGCRTGDLPAADRASRDADQLLLHLVDGTSLSASDLARTIGVSYSTISMRIHRARRRTETTSPSQEQVPPALWLR